MLASLTQTLALTFSRVGGFVTAVHDVLDYSRGGTIFGTLGILSTRDDEPVFTSTTCSFGALPAEKRPKNECDWKTKRREKLAANFFGAMDTWGCLYRGSGRLALNMPSPTTSLLPVHSLWWNIEYWIYIFYKDYQIVSTNVKELLGRWFRRNRKRHESLSESQG